MLLLHGALGAAPQFDPLVPLLADRFTIQTLNFQGHGGRPFPERPFSIHHCALEVLEWMQEQGMEQTDIVGHSMGGYVGLYLARHYPSHVGRLLTLGTKFDWNPEGAARDTKMLNPEAMQQKAPQFYSAMQERHGPGNLDELLRRTAEMMTRLGESPEVTPEDLAQIHHHVRVAVGDRDQMVSIQETAAAYRQLPNGQCAVLPATPHPIEKVPLPRLVAEIQEFFC
ncbi:MAG: alpha/beta fold hydrolase [Chlorobi bacterium CHB2]|nr:alpha/beta fold hydrolase [Chlorobi bacterium CHB2]